MNRLDLKNLLPALRENLVAARRRAWFVDTFIFAQVPAKVEKETIQGMISLPPVVKSIFEDDWLVISEENAWSPYLSDIPKV